MSDDLGWVLWQSEDGEIFLKRWPDGERRWRIAVGSGFEPHWLSSNTIVLTDPSSNIWTMEFRPEADPPHGPMELLLHDPLKMETAGWSTVVTPEGEFIYPHLPDPSPARSLRVVRGWVDEIKRAVDEANR